MSYKYKLYGAILGDLAGQPYEFKYKGDYSEFNLHDERSRFTDDTIMTLATAGYLLGKFNSFDGAYRLLGNKYINLDCFGKKFKEWLSTNCGETFDSWGNGCLMRISPIMYLGLDNNKTKELIVESCMNSHNHPKSIIAALGLYSIYRTSTYQDSDFILKYKFDRYQNFIKFDKFDVSAEGTLEFIRKSAFDTYNTQLTIEKTVKCGGDTDTNASIAGELHNYIFQDLTKEDIEYVESKLDPYLLGILHEFNEKF